MGAHQLPLYQHLIIIELKALNFMTPFYGSSSTELGLLRRGSLLFATKFPEISGTHFIDLGMMKG